MSTLRIPERVVPFLRCPACGSELARSLEEFECLGLCRRRFAIVDGVPILLCDELSVFSASSSVQRRTTYRAETHNNRIASVLRNLVPSISMNPVACSNYARVGALVSQLSSSPTVLVIGGGASGEGITELAQYGTMLQIQTDVDLTHHVTLVCDAHNLPFADCVVDAVVIQAVLEHVVDPRMCCDEIHRVLTHNGLVYAETPFMQQVHAGALDFGRFTHLGHRRLFRRFSEIDSGATGGPGMVLAWAYQYFLTSFVTSKRRKIALRAFARLTSFFLKYFDYYLLRQPGTFDAASGYYFIGRKSESVLTDRELLKQYRGTEL